MLHNFYSELFTWKKETVYQSLYYNGCSSYVDDYEVATLMTTPMPKIRIKKIKENKKPFILSTTSLFLDCGFFSNSFIVTPPMSPIV